MYHHQDARFQGFIALEVRKCEPKNYGLLTEIAPRYENRTLSRLFHWCLGDFGGRSLRIFDIRLPVGSFADACCEHRMNNQEHQSMLLTGRRLR